MLSNEQMKVVLADAKRSHQIIACAGSGKTTTLVHRVRHLMNCLGVSGSEILICTFTKNSAEDLHKRIHDDEVYVGTFHALSARLFGEYNGNHFMTGSYHVDEFQYRLKAFLESKSEDALRLRTRFKHIFVDEFQDVNRVQFQLVKLLSQNTDSVVVVGDDDQSIYAFRGCSNEFIRTFRADFPNVDVHFLSVNYRSSPQIVKLAASSIAHNATFIAKPVTISSVEAKHLELQFAKCTCILRDTVKHQHHHNQQPQQQMRPKLPTLQLFANVTDADQHVADEIQACLTQGERARNICIMARGNKSLNMMRGLLAQKGIASVQMTSDDRFAKCQTTMDIKDRDKVILSTVHSSKGLEWDRVYLIGMHNRNFPDYREECLDRERRLFYVAVTRCRTHLVIVANQSYPSIFLTELRDGGLVSNIELVSNETIQATNLSIKHRFEDVRTPSDWANKISVTGCIHSLTGRDYQYLRKRNILMKKMLDQLVVDEIETPNKYPVWVSNNNLEAQFGVFLECLAHRMMAARTQPPSRMFYRSADRVMASEDKMSSIPDDIQLIISESYDRYRNNFLNWTDVLVDTWNVALLNAVMHDMHVVLWVQVTATEIKSSMDIYLTLQNFVEINVEPESIIVSSREIRLTCQVHDALQDDEFVKFLLSEDMPEVETMSVFQFNKLKNEIRQSHITRHGNRPICMTGEIDATIDDAIIDFKNSTVDVHVCDLEHFLQVLAYASLMRIDFENNVTNSFAPKKVILHNVTGDITFEIGVSEWIEVHVRHSFFMFFLFTKFVIGSYLLHRAVKREISSQSPCTIKHIK